MHIRNGIKRVAALLFVAVLCVRMLPAQQADAVPSQAEVDEKISWIIASIPDDCDTDYEKALWLHDYLCKTVTYKLGEADYGYTALINGVADCGGYADAYTKLLRAVGIPCYTVHGDAGVAPWGGPHAWNAVILDGECYFTDVTWDDLGNNDIITYRYFNLSFEEMANEDHRASSVTNDSTNHFYLPEECNHTKYKYTIADTNEPGYGSFNSSTAVEELVNHCKVVKVDGSQVTFYCNYLFDGDEDAHTEWIVNKIDDLEEILGCPQGFVSTIGTGYGGILSAVSTQTSFIPTESISFAEPTVHLNNSHMRQQLSVNFAPANASYQNVTYTSSDSRIAKVDENGVVRAVSSGMATITATAVDGKTVTCQVVVNHSHNAIRAVSAVTANCVTKGYKAHYICDSCGTRFSDSKGQNVVSLMDLVSFPTSYCSYLNYNTYHNEEGHWKVCRLCGKWGNTSIIPHQDWDDDGICDGFGSSYQPCGYVMNPSATHATQATTKPAQSTNEPVQSGTSSTKPPVVTTEPPTVTTAPPTTAPITEGPLPVESTGTPTQTEQASSTEGTTESIGTAQSIPAASNPVQPNQTPGFQWIALVLIGAVVVVIVIILIMRRRKR